jgi:hypothetical protein
MTMANGFARKGHDFVTTQPVAIVSVDLNSRIAVGRTAYSTEVRIDIGHMTGGLQVTPCVGEQWYVESVQGIYRLKNKIPFNTDEISKPAVEGQVQIGSKGPLELNGGQINANGPLRISPYSTAMRPSATSLDAGTMIFDTSLKKPIWSDGVKWRDASGVEV